MIEALCVVITLLALATTAVFAFRVLKVERKLEWLSARPSQPALVTPVIEKPLAGLRVALAVKQDYPHPVFETLLKEILLSEDVAEVQKLNPDEATAWIAQPDGSELLIAGELVGNGYAEVYYRADFTCWIPGQAISTVVERPPNGDRPSNYAKELVARLKSDLQTHSSRDERRRAIRELHVD